MYSILRTYNDDCTTGVLVDSLGIHLCVTLERSWLENKNSISCIPEGTYNVIAYNSPTKGDVWLIQNVPDRSMIEIHSCNWVEQLEGCIGVGDALLANVMDADGITHKHWISNSKITLAKLKKTMPQGFVLEIRKG